MVRTFGSNIYGFCVDSFHTTGECGIRIFLPGDDFYLCLLVIAKNFLACGFRPPRNWRSRNLAQTQARRRLTWQKRCARAAETNP